MCEIETTTDRAAEETGEAQSGDQWLTPCRFGLLLALLVIVTFPGVMLLGQSFVLGDFGPFSYPLAYFHRQSFWRGELPMWNPLNHCGLPFLAQWNTLTLYPPALLYLLLPMPWSVSFFCVAHLFWGGLGMYFLAQQWTTNRWGAGVAGIVFAFNGLTIHSLMWPSQEATWTWLPWVLWLTQEGWRHGGRKVVWAIAAGAMQMLAGGPETILMTWGILLLLACGDWLTEVKQQRMTAQTTASHEPAGFGLRQSSGALASSSDQDCRDSARGLAQSKTLARRFGRSSGLLLWARFFGIAMLVALLCAIQLLPFLELVAHSQRDRGFDGSNLWAMPSWGWANFLVPLFRTGATPQGVLFQNGQSWVSSYYAGIGTLWLSILGLIRQRQWHVRLLGILTIVGLLLALGKNGPLYPLLRAWVPLIGLARFPVKFVILILAVVPILAAFGIKDLSRPFGQVSRLEMGIAGLLIVLLGVVVVWDWRSAHEDWATPWRSVFLSGLSRTAFLLITLLLFAVFMRSSQRRRILSGGAILIVFWLDFATHVPPQHPTVSASAYAPGWARGSLGWASGQRLGEGRAMMSPAAQGRLQQYMHPNPSPIEPYLIFRLAMLPDCNLLDGVPLSYGFFPLVPKEINAATTLPYRKPKADFSPLLDFMGISSITAPGRMFDWAVRNSAMPILTCGQKPIFADADTSFQALAETNRDFREVVFLPIEAQGKIHATRQTQAKILSSEFENQMVSVQMESPAEVVSIISQGYYPAWKAYVDGQPVRLWRANYAFQAVEVPAGRHRLDLRYEDKMFRLGMILSLFAMAVTATLWARTRAPNEPQRKPVGLATWRPYWALIGKPLATDQNRVC